MSLDTVNQVGGAIITGLTATGPNRATALQLANRSGLNEITTVAANTGVILPMPKRPGMTISIANQGASTLNVYPQLGGTIDNGTANAAVTLLAGKSATYEASSLMNWYTIASTAAAAGSGSVTSVTFTGDGTVLSSTPSLAVTTSGTVTAALATQSANVVLAGPATGSAANPTFRALVAADLATQSANVVLAGPATGSAANPTFRALVAADLATQSANVILAGPATGSAANPTFRALVAADLPTTGINIASHFGAIMADTDGATITFNLGTSDWHAVTLGGNRTLALSGGTTGQQFTLALTQDGTGSRTVTWFATIKWPGATVPTLTTAAGKTDIFTFKQYGTGTYYGFVAGQNL
jgi:hypothetical protein